MTANEAAAKAAYEEHAESIETLCDLIRACYSPTPHTVNWADVATAAHVAKLLEAITDFIGNGGR